MVRTKRLLAAIAVALWLGAAASRAAAAENEPGAGEPGGRTEVQAFEAAPISAADAIAAAERHTGGRALEVGFDAKGGQPVYKVKTYQDGAVWEGEVDARTGGIVGEERTIAEKDLDREDKAELAALKKSKVSLGDAVRAAERKGGKVMSAGLEERNGKVAYEIELVKNALARRAVVDTITGRTSVAVRPLAPRGTH